MARHLKEKGMEWGVPGVKGTNSTFINNFKRKLMDLYSISSLLPFCFCFVLFSCPIF